MVRPVSLACLLSVAACSFDSTATGSTEGDHDDATEGRTSEASSDTAGDAFPSTSEASGGSDSTGEAEETGSDVPSETWKRRRLEFDLLPLATPLHDIPIAVLLTGERVDFDAAGQDGSRLHFRAGDSDVALAHEIERWDASGRAVVWVRVPELTGGDDVFWMYYGDEHSTLPDPTEVWSADYAGVWHLGDDPQASVALDATVHGNAGEALGPAMPGAQGPLGEGWFFGGEGAAIRVPTDPSLDPVDALTIEGWVQLDVVDESANRYVAVKREAYLVHATRTWTTIPFVYVHTAGEWYDGSWGASLDLQWHHLVATYDRQTEQFRMMLDGELSAVQSIARDVDGEPISSGLDALFLGEGMEGRLDEVRVSNVARSPEWIQVQYASMVDTLLVFGAEEPG